MHRMLDIGMMAWQSISTRLTRSLLMMLGVTIGVASVIALVAAGNGASAQVAARVESLGANLLFVAPGPGVQLTATDLQLIPRITSLVTAVLPVVSSAGPLVYGGQNMTVPITGTDQLWPALRDAPVARGRFLTARDVQQDGYVVSLGSQVASELFGSMDPVGAEVRLDGATFTVIGVMAPKGASFGANQDLAVFIPYTTAQLLLQTDQLSEIDVQVSSAAVAGYAADEITRYYTIRYQDNPQAVQVSSEDSLLSTIEKNRRTFTFLLGGTAAISLLVGGIGIMNIMLVAVAERTREIGVRKALGARSRDVLAQFLTEAVALSGAGGLIGVVLGLSGAGSVAHLAGWHDLIVPSSVALAFGFALGVGMVFGAYPAARAAALDPIEALRQQ